MAFPWVANTEDAFEGGAVNTTIWDGTNVDTNSKLFIRHYTWMARQGFIREVPYRGAYCMHIDLSLGTGDAYLESTNWATALDGVIATRFAFLASGLTMGATDRFAIFSLQSAGPVNEAMVEVRMSSGVLQILASETGGATVVATSLTQNEWHLVQLVANIDAGGGNDGTLALWIDGRLVGTIASLDQAAIAQARLGVVGIDAGTTAGHLFFDWIVADEARLPEPSRNQPTTHITATGHIRVGRGEIQEIRLIDSGDSTAQIAIYDTDTGDTSQPLFFSGQYNDAWVNESQNGNQGQFQDGCYVVLTGTNPQAFLSFRECAFAPGGVANAALARK